MQPLAHNTMTLGHLYRQLAAPAKTGGIADVLVAFRSVQITAIISGAGPLVEHPGLLPKLRGAFGASLLDGACASAAQGQCSCHPACGATILFAPKPHVIIDGVTTELAKPYCIAATRHGARDIALTVTLFGAATCMAGAARQAWGEAVTHGVPWDFLTKDMSLSLPSGDPALMKITVRENGPMRTEVIPQTASLDFKTGIELNNRDECVLSSDDIFRRLIIRASLLAPWFGLKLQRDFSPLQQAWQRLDVHIEPGVEPVVRPRVSHRTGQSWASSTLRPIVTLNGDLQEIWPYLLMGEQTHVGRGAVSGAGRYVLEHDSV
jgi:hypothetical protein